VIEPTGSETQVLGKLGGETFIGVFRERFNTRPGEMLAVTPDLSSVHLFDAVNGVRLT
jgi:multiple sugar transport system ATP-binding protein